MKKQLFLTMAAVLASLTMNAQVVLTKNSKNQTFKTSPTGISGFTSSANADATLSEGNSYTGYRSTKRGTSFSCKYEFDVVSESEGVSGNISFGFLTYAGNSATIKITVGNQKPQIFSQAAGTATGAFAKATTNIAYEGIVAFTTTPTHVVVEFTDVSIGNEDPVATYSQARLYAFTVKSK